MFSDTQTSVDRFKGLVHNDCMRVCGQQSRNAEFYNENRGMKLKLSKQWVATTTICNRHFYIMHE